jgi:hypothetical protein
MIRHPRLAAGGVALLFSCALACTGGNSNLNSGESSGNSGNSSGNSSGGSANSSGGSNSNSSGGGGGTGGNSFQGSGETTGNTANGLNASADSTANSVQGSIASTSQGTADSSAQSTRASGPVLSTVAVGVTVVGVGYLIWGPATRASFALPPPVPAPAAPVAAAQFLRANERQLRIDLAVGAGPAIEDLAAMAEIQPRNLERFGRLLREHRGELLTWTDARALTPGVAVQVLRRIGEIASSDGALAEDGRAFRERHPGT